MLVANCPIHKCHVWCCGTLVKDKTNLERSFCLVVACFENLNFLKVVKEAIGFESIISMITSLSRGLGKTLVVLK